MKNLGILVGFLPLIVYAILSGNTLQSQEIALLAAGIISLVVGFRTLKRGFYLDWANFLMFAGALIGVAVLNITVIAEYMSIIIYLVLALVAFGSLIAGVPFTIQYARDMVDKSRWDHPVFKSVNVFMTGVWGILFVINLALVTYAKFSSGLFAQVAGVAIYAVLVLGIAFTVLYPAYLQKKQQALPVQG
jgi:all-trans-retinol 13,14-reductase